MVTNVYVSAVTSDNISRHELLAWVNTLLNAQLSKIEEMSTGAAYAQLIHILFPAQISLKKIRFNSKNEVDHLNNWKIVGQAWKVIGIDKPLLVDRLVKAKFQDNFEFLQWWYKFFNANITDAVEDYDALAHRNGEALPIGAKGPARPLAPRNPAPRAPVTTAPRAPAAAAVRKAPPTATAPRTTAAKASAAPPSSSADKKRIEELEALLQERDEALLTAESERLFYFDKLRLVEDMCTALADGEQPDKEAILQILYAADTEANGAAPAEEELLFDDALEDGDPAEPKMATVDDDGETF